MKVKYAYSVLVLSMLAACGGGGGSAPVAPPVVTPPVANSPAPTVAVSISRPKTTVDSAVTVSWTSTNATSCVGLDSMSGTKAINNSEQITPSKGGQYTYTISCDGEGGTAKQSVNLVVPMPVLRSSYENKMAAGAVLGPQTMPILPPFGTANATQLITSSFAYGDFFQDGSYSMVGVAVVFDKYPQGYGPSIKGDIFFFHNDGKGGWINQTDKLLGANDRTGCLSPRKLIVADFNGDKKPDVFIACHGYDGELPVDAQRYAKPRYLLSQSDGTYKNFEVNFDCYCHSATAADFTGSGFADVITSNFPYGNPKYLSNNNGTFVELSGKLPNSINNEAIWTIDLVDANNDGKFDLATMGSENLGTNQTDWQGKIFTNDGTNHFSDSNAALTIPLNGTYDLTLDMIVQNSKIALLRTNGYKSLVVDIYSVTGQTVNLISETMAVVNSATTVWFTLFNGNVVNMDASKPYSIPF